MESEQEQLMKVLLSKGQSAEEAQETMRQLTYTGTGLDLPHRAYFESWYALESLDQAMESGEWS